MTYDPLSELQTQQSGERILLAVSVALRRACMTANVCVSIASLVVHRPDRKSEVRRQRVS